MLILTDQTRQDVFGNQQPILLHYRHFSNYVDSYEFTNFMEKHYLAYCQREGFSAYSSKEQISRNGGDRGAKLERLDPELVDRALARYSIAWGLFDAYGEFVDYVATEVVVTVGTVGAGALAGRLAFVRKIPQAVVHGHHPLPKFLGGNVKQTLSRLDSKIHTEFHRLLCKNLRNAGIRLNVGGRGGSYRDWAQYMNANPGSQRKVLDASRSIDAKYGTNIVQDVWNNVMDSSFTPFP